MADTRDNQCMARHTIGVGRFLTPADAAQILVVPLSTILDLIESGELPAIRVGAAGRLRVERSALDAYVDDLYERRRRELVWRGADEGRVTEIAGGAVILRADALSDRPGR
jgi:excisionase family DNA binding protein